MEPIAARAPAVMLFTFAALAPIVILRPAYAFPLSLQKEPSIARRVDIVYGDKIKLLGYEVSPSQAAPNSWLEMTLYWQSLAEMDEDYSIGIHLLDSSHRVISARDSYPGHGMLPTSLWRAGQIIQDPYWVPVAADTTGLGIAEIQVDLYVRGTKRDLPARDPQGRAVTPIIGRLRIAPANSTALEIRNKTQFVFGQQVALVGYEINRSVSQAPAQAPNPSQGTDLTLYWKRVGAISTDYTVFVHILDGNGEVVAQKDQEPREGASPTSLWEDGEVVVDLYNLVLPADARGPFRVEMGLYQTQTGERLPVVDAAGSALGDHLVLEAYGAGQ